MGGKQGVELTWNDPESVFQTPGLSCFFRQTSFLKTTLEYESNAKNGEN